MNLRTRDDSDGRLWMRAEDIGVDMRGLISACAASAGPSSGDELLDDDASAQCRVCRPHSFFCCIRWKVLMPFATTDFAF